MIFVVRIHRAYSCNEFEDFQSTFSQCKRHKFVTNKTLKMSKIPRGTIHL